MNKPNKHQEKLSHAVEATRQELLTRLKDAQTARDAALFIRDHAAHEQQEACKQMGDNEQVLAVASRIQDLAADTQLLARNLTLFADDSQSGAEALQTAMAEAATAIKNASGAMQALTMEIHGVAAVTQTRNKGNEVEAKALAASHVVTRAMESAEELQSLSLQASITAAAPLAGSVAQAFSVLSDQVATLVTDTTQARDTARQELATTTTHRDLTQRRYFASIPPFEKRQQETQSLLTSLQQIDHLASSTCKVAALPTPASA